MVTSESRGRGEKAADIASRYRAQILDGALTAGDRLPSFSELRSLLGAAPNTVDRAYAELEREGLVVREQGRGTFVAQRKRVRRHAVGCYSFDPLYASTPYWNHLMAGIQQVANREEMEVTLLHARSMRGLEHVDGVLLHDANSADLLARLPTDIPAVALIETIDGVSSIVADDCGGAADATRHLLARGHRNIACLMYQNSPVGRMRLAGYRQALEAAGLPYDASRIGEIQNMGFTTLRENAMATMRQWLQTDWRSRRYTAVICQNDGAAFGAIQALAEAGLHVPRDVSVIGFDGTEEGELTTPRLTSVRVPLQEIGTAAMELLLQAIHAPQVQLEHVVLPCGLTLRESTGPAPG